MPYTHMHIRTWEMRGETASIENSAVRVERLGRRKSTPGMLYEIAGRRSPERIERIGSIPTWITEEADHVTGSPAWWCPWLSWEIFSAHPYAGPQPPPRT